jgi:hypothetical protein
VQFWRCPAIQYFVQECNLPGIAMGNASQPTPFVDIPRPGDKVVFEDFTMSFPVDENMQNYREIASWIVALGFPRSYGQYAEIAASSVGTTSNITLMILDSHNQPQHTVTFTGAFPHALSGIQFDTKVPDTTIPIATASFKYVYWELDSTVVNYQDQTVIQSVNDPSTIVTQADSQ